MEKVAEKLVDPTVPYEDMTNFIKVCKQADEEVHFYKISEINKEKDKINIEKGKRVRVIWRTVRPGGGLLHKSGKKERSAACRHYSRPTGGFS